MRHKARKYVLVTQTEDGLQYAWDNGERLSTRRFKEMFADGQLKASDDDTLFLDSLPQVFWVVKESQT
jgi:hypothetical protein